MISRPFFLASALLLTIGIGSLAACGAPPASPTGLNEGEITALRTLSIANLPPVPPDPSNAFADNQQAAVLGQKLFFDTQMSANGKVACATCHQQERAFTDGLPFSQGVGTTGRSAPSILGTAYSRFIFWDGRKDSQWAQALGPLESPVEHGSTRTFYAHLLDKNYRADYEAIFGPMPDLSDSKRFPDTAGPVKDAAAKAAWEAMAPADQDVINRIYSNIGKAIAAYERKVRPGTSRFDTYIQTLADGNTQAAQATLTPDEIAGARLFVGKAQCMTCHSGPMLADNNFYDLNVPPAKENPDDAGRASGAKQVLADEFNCLGKYSDAKPSDCTYLNTINPNDPKFNHAFRTMTLRNIAETGPYMHAGQFKTLEEVVKHYNAGIPGRSPLNLTETEIGQLVAFLKTLSAPVESPMITTAMR